MIKLLKALTLLFLVLFILPGCEKECENLKMETEPCDALIDKSIIIDTLWSKNLDTYIYKPGFSKKYFWVNFDHSVFNIYSINTGEYITKIDQEMVPHIYSKSVQIQGDYLYCYSFVNSGDITNFRFNLLTNELDTLNVPDNGAGLKFEDDYFYFKTKSGIIKTDYNVSYLDTIYHFAPKTNSYHVHLETYDFPEAINKKYLIIAYDSYQETPHSKKIVLSIIDKETGKNIAGFSNRSFSDILDFSVCDNMINLSTERELIVYDLKNKLYFSYSLNISNNERVYSIGGRETQDGYKNPMVLFHNVHSLNAFDMKTSNPVWFCKEHRFSSLYPIDLIDKNGNIFPYMVYSRGNKGGLIDPYTGIIKAIFGYPIIENISPVINKNELFYWTDNRILKIKITKK